MLQALSLAFLVTIRSCAEGRDYTNIITVKNGGPKGTWGRVEFCPAGQFATGFALKVQSARGYADDTGLNGIRLFCGGGITSAIESKIGRWGKWTRLVIQCPRTSYLAAFSLKVQPPQGDGDDTAANSIIFRCSYGKQLLGHGGSRGSWGEWSDACKKGICGIQTKVEDFQGTADDTALNDVRFYCCNN
ncbi:vitelline membrane outer layer protein 1-like [Ambystoma mexicanum]|uniref:vitelline membrane outer layer protein 1-like n=1 Tax=Ambystoma mexicanum TaxID=8296 RepID=UPI0037E989EA